MRLRVNTRGLRYRRCIAGEEGNVYIFRKHLVFYCTKIVLVYIVPILTVTLFCTCRKYHRRITYDYRGYGSEDLRPAMLYRYICILNRLIGLSHRA